MSAEDVRQRVTDAVERFNAGDLDGYIASYAPGAVIHGLPSGDDAGPADLRRFLETLLTGLPDLQVVIEDSIVEEGRFAARLTYRGTHRGELLGAAPTDRTIEWTASRSAT